MRLSPLGTAATVWPIVPASDDDDDCGGIGGCELVGETEILVLGENLP
jgi:hypothetical protein